MAQTGSAQREPSMEEILASIRRIIEDSDQGAPPAEQPAIHADDALPSEDVEAFRAELDEPAPSMADIQNAMKSDVEPAPVARIHALRAEPTPEQSADQAIDAAIEDALRDHDEQPAAASLSFVEDDKADDVVDDEPAVDDVPAAASFDAPAEAKGSLISDVTERQVVAAFGELSDAFAASRRRSFDEMAEDMLRPMLQDWLDNNLPGLVEKLVREEIERVARGGKD